MIVFTSRNNLTCNPPAARNIKIAHAKINGLEQMSFAFTFYCNLD